MVKKLYKHEILALGRLMLPVLCAVLGVGLFTRIILLFESDTVAYKIIEGSSFVVLVLAMIASVFLALIFGVVRYYKNLFSCEGYLSFTIPVTPAQHLWVKVSVAVLFEVGAVLASILALAIAFSGEPIVELFKAADYLWELITQQVSAAHLVTYFIEFLLLMLVSFFGQYLLYYTCITIGQMAKKNRVLAAVGVYFAYYLCTQILSTVFTIVLAGVGSIEVFERFGRFAAEHPYLSVHLVFVGLIVWALILNVAYYLICHIIIRKKLNLE
ncbi:MAG: hypothetical protein UHS49_00165 [Faecalimonas sp.]|nr:hypothetical protein [Faecalimonas sp.]